MKRLVVVLIALFAATTLFAGDGAHCDMKKSSVKKVSLTGKIVRAGDDATVFQVSNDGEKYTVCHKTKASILALGDEGATLQVKGKLVSCGEAEGQELMIEEAKKI